MHGRDPDRLYFRGDGDLLRAAFEEWGPGHFRSMLQEMGECLDGYDLVLVHQVSGTLFEAFVDVTGVRPERTIPIVDKLGNIASASIPVQLDMARREGRVGPGSRILLVGLGAGISLGLITLRL